MIPGVSSFRPTLDSPARDPALHKAAQQFEAVFLRQLIGTMRQARLAEEMFGSSASDSFRELADARMAETLSQTGQFGLVGMIERQLASGRTGRT